MQQNNQWTPQRIEKAPGLRIGTKLVVTFLGLIALLAVALVFTYLHFVPPIVNAQVEQRAYSVSQSFASAVLEPVVVRNYLRVNKIAEFTAQLPDVAYVSVVNKRGVPIAGIFGDLAPFERSFADGVREQGFPRQLAEQNSLVAGEQDSRRHLEAGGQRIFAIAVPVGDTGAVAHLGLFTAATDAALQRSLFPLLVLLAVICLVGAIGIALIARTVSHPIRLITEQAYAISSGRLDHQLSIKGGGEIWELSRSFTHMQAAIRHALEQMRRRAATVGGKP